MTSINSFKTSTVAGSSSATPKSGKLDTASSSTPAPVADSYIDQLKAAGLAKMGKTPATDAGTGDPVGDLLSTLDQISGQGVPAGNLIPFQKISAESALSKSLEHPEDVVTKFNSVVTIIENKLAELDKALASGTGTPQQVQVAQKLKAELKDLDTYYKVQRDKAVTFVDQKKPAWKAELQNFIDHGGTDDVRSFDKDGDGWIGQPEAPDSYRIAKRGHDEHTIDPVAKKLHDAGAKNIKYEFKKGEDQYWAMKVNTDGTTGNRVQFDPVSGKVINDQVAKPGYTADMGAGFGDPDNGNITLDEKGQITLRTSKDPRNAVNFAEAGLELHTPEYIYVQVDSDGNPAQDDNGHFIVAPFTLVGGRLTQPTPDPKGEVQYKQVYVSKMQVRSVPTDNKAGGDISINFFGNSVAGVDGSSLMTLTIKGPNDKTKATDTALAITSGDGSSHRETNIILDAGAYQSTCRQGIQDASHFSTEFNYVNNNSLNSAVNDTLKNFVAKDSKTGEIESKQNVGIAFRTKGHITGTVDNDLFVVEEPASYEPPFDTSSTAPNPTPNPQYTSVIDGQGGHNALFATKGSLYATGMTLVSKDSGDSPGLVSIGVSAFGSEDTTKAGKGSNKLYIHVNAPQATVRVQSSADGIDNDADDMNKGQGDPNGINEVNGWKKGDDDYLIHALEVATTAYDSTGTNQVFDPDMQQKDDGSLAIQGTLSGANTGDFSQANGLTHEMAKAIDDSVKTPVTDTSKSDWVIDGAKTDWMQGKYYQGDKDALETFFSGFSASKLNSVDPFQQLADGEKQATGDNTK